MERITTDLHDSSELISPPARRFGDGKQSARILLADDEPSVRDLLVRVLAGQGWEITAVAHGQEAVDAWPEGGEPFHVVILDLMMPKMNGYEAYRILRGRHPQARVLFISGYAYGKAWDAVSSEGLPRITKPFGLDELVAEVRGMLNPLSPT